MVEPRLGGGTVEHPVGLVVAAIHVQVELKIGGDVGARVSPARVERSQDPWHFAQQRVEVRRVGELRGPGLAVASDEEVVGGHLLKFPCAAQWTGDEVPKQPALEGPDIASGETQLRELANDAEELSGAAWELAWEDEGGLAIHRGALGDHPPDVVHDGACGRYPAGLAARRRYVLIDRNALEQVPDMQVVRREEAEAVFTRKRSPGKLRIAPPAREGTQLGRASVVRAHGRVLGRGEAAELDRRVGARRHAAQPVAFVFAGFEHRDVETPLGQFVRCRQARDTGSQHRDRGAPRARGRGGDGLAHGGRSLSAASSAGCDGARTAAWT